MRMLLLGDTHGDSSWIFHALDYADKQGCDRIVQLGDFGYWPHTDRGQEFLGAVDTEASRLSIPIFWVDGNHENHDMLDELTAKHGHEDFIPVGESVLYCPRGFRWKWEGVTFMSLGGAFSIDRMYRTLGSSWWEQETLTKDDIDRATQYGSVDVMFTHDAPLGVTPWPASTGKNLYPESRINRQLLTEAVAALRPEYLFHGHYHHRYENFLALDHRYDLKVTGLGNEGSEDSMYVFDTAEESIGWGVQDEPLA